MGTNFAALLRVTCARKLARRARKKLKSVCTVAHSRHKKVEMVIQDEDDARTKLEKRRQKRRRQRERKRTEQQQQRNIGGDKTRRNGSNGIDAEGDGTADDNNNDPFDDEECTVKQFQAEAERMRKKRMVNELEDDERVIQRLEAKLRKRKKRSSGKKLSLDELSADGSDLEKAILSGGDSD